MAPNKTAELILEKWIASLKTRDRSKKATPDNFDEFFAELKKADVSFDDAHNLLPIAVKAHLPKKAVIKNTWIKHTVLHGIYKNSDEFAEEWNDSIKNTATDAFFSNYPLKINDDDDGEPKVYGNMSVKEYRLQRKYADAFPRLDTDDLIRQMKERKSLIGDLDGALGDKDE